MDNLTPARHHGGDRHLSGLTPDEAAHQARILRSYSRRIRDCYEAELALFEDRMAIATEARVDQRLHPELREIVLTVASVAEAASRLAQIERDVAEAIDALGEAAQSLRGAIDVRRGEGQAIDGAQAGRPNPWRSRWRKGV